MLLWVGFAVLTAAVVAALLRPLLASAAPDAASAGASEAAVSGAAGAVYRDQLAEIDAEARRGLIGEGEAEAARVEIARRLLATAGTESARVTSASAHGPLTAVTMVLAVALPIAAIAAYLAIGAPTQPGQPHASRAAPEGSTPGVGKLVAQVEERLRANPEDGRGWDVIAPVYLRMGRYNDAANAFQRALRLVGESPDRLAGLAESHVLASDGVVTEAARAAYARLQQLDPDQVTPRFWLAVAAEQDGRFDEALAAYTTLLREGDEAAGWRPTVVERWRTVRTKLGQTTDSPPVGKSAAAAPAGNAPALAPAGKAPALAKDAVDAAQAMTPDARRQMIEDMVAGLDKRLSEDGRDLEGWQRLIRAYAVLGRRDQALAALKRAQAALAEEAPSLEILAALAKSLGLAS
jgi:cytochrome c-type biogenesis protein CcmH